MVSDELLHTIYIFRGIERLIIEVGAIGCVAAGTLLYKWGVQGNSNVSTEAPGFKFQVGNAAPGTVLALFGMTIMAVALANPARYDEKGDHEVALSASAPPGSATPTPRPAPSGSEQGTADPSATPPSPGVSSAAPLSSVGKSVSYAGTNTDVRRFVERLAEEDRTADPQKELASVTAEAKNLLQALPDQTQRALLEHAAGSGSAVHGHDEAGATLNALSTEARALR